ncbi:SpoIIE family protein phosphatase [Gracilinema caldarium]|uniref:SpoIIE family protein phosphatase n=1 Tax=Gracilinema caldarium TaxID=215591 RepID=UPI0026EAA87D|nr:SpoIIE family protein phosphatase [Gracilinema caldarium]
MKTLEARETILSQTNPQRRYSNSILNIAKYLWYAPASVKVLDLTDELQLHPEIAVFAVVDRAGRYLGIVEREALFSLVGKPFGREVLQRSLIKELLTHVSPFDGRQNSLTVAQQIHRKDEENSKVTSDTGEIGKPNKYYPLVDENGIFQGIFSLYDLNEYLATITRNDIELAGRIQERLLSTTKIEGSRYSVVGWSRSAKGVGGDFYFMQEIQNGMLFATLCDVSGKGVSASLIVSMLWGMLRTYDFRRGLRDLIVTINKAIVSTFHMEKYLTGFFMIFDPEHSKLLCADMGHSHVYLIRNRHIRPIKGRLLNIPIGIEGDVSPSLMGLQLQQGDRLFVYTDGITEQINGVGEEFGEERLKKLLLSLSGDGQLLTERLAEQIDLFREGVPQQDDMSFLLFNFEI